MLTNLLCVCVCEYTLRTAAKHLNLIEIINAAIQIAIDLGKVLSMQCNQSIFTATRMLIKIELKFKCELFI